MVNDDPSLRSVFDSLYSNYCGYVHDCLDEVMGHEYGKAYAYEYIGYGACLLHLLYDYLHYDPCRTIYKKSILHLMKQLEKHYEIEHFGFSSPKQNAEMSEYVKGLEYGA